MTLHICRREDWEDAQQKGEYTHPSLQQEGFIHASEPTEAQLILVANTFFAGQSGLVLLCIDPNRLTAPLRREEFESSGLFFPHIYGPVNLDAVTEVLDFEPGPDGRFSLPDVLIPRP